VVARRGWRPIALAVAGLAMVAGLSACSGGGVHLTAVFADIGDLQSRGSVQTADVRIGTIGRINLTKDFRARVSLSLYPGVKVPRNSVALVRTTSLLGEKFIELRPQGDPAAPPFFRSGDTVERTGAAPELEFFAQSAVSLLGAVNASSVATLVDTGAQATAARGSDIAALVGDLSHISATLAGRSGAIGAIIDHLDRATQTLAGGSGDISALLANLAATSKTLAADRDQAVTALASLARLARAGNYSLAKYGAAIDTQVKQLDVITGALANASGEVGNLVDWLARFIAGLPKIIPGDFQQLVLWVIPAAIDPRAGH
jgi:phospholipid/cholesterol/gamma-HCH transport system substrate-binding protein